MHRPYMPASEFMHDVLPLLRPLFSVCMRSHSYVRPFDIQTMEPTLSFTCAVNHRSHHIKALPGMYSYKYSPVESLVLRADCLVVVWSWLSSACGSMMDYWQSDRLPHVGFQIYLPSKCSSKLKFVAVRNASNRLWL